MSAAPPPDRDRWRQANDLFHRALDLPVEERGAFVDAQCGDDRALYSEVTTLLAAHGHAGDFIEAPPVRAIGPYEILRVIGSGGMGIVYLARDTRLNRTVALKALAPPSTGDRVREERLRREARAAATLHHSAIATVFALEEIDGQLYIASEYVDGETLREELERGPLPPRDAAETALAIARALVVAHGAGIVHRDLKPENVIRSADGHIKVLDFGMARVPASDTEPLTRDGAVFGTPAYMSPEQIRGVPVDGRSDLFSLGVMFYELLTGLHPFQRSEAPATLARILETVPPRPSAIVPLAAPLDDLVAACLSKDPQTRLPSALEAVARLERIIPLLRGATAGQSTGDLAAAGSMMDTGAVRRARWWWRFHQAGMTVLYGLLLIPLWYARPQIWVDRGRSLFLGGVIAAVVSGILRLHLWFTDDLYPSEWDAQQHRASPWILLADFTFVAVLLIAGILVLYTGSVLAIVLVAGAVSTLISFTIIEPATRRAFRGQEPEGGRRE